jgi:hypothetical protein
MMIHMRLIHIGSVMYMVNTGLDSCHAVNVLGHFMSQMRQTH